jgi:hypothetical protein
LTTPQQAVAKFDIVVVVVVVILDDDDYDDGVDDYDDSDDVDDGFTVFFQLDVQKLSATISMYQNILAAMPSILVSLFLGPWCDLKVVFV